MTSTNPQWWRTQSLCEQKPFLVNPKAHFRVPSLPQPPSSCSPLAFAWLDHGQTEGKKEGAESPGTHHSISLPWDALLQLRVLVLLPFSCWTVRAKHFWSDFVPLSYMVKEEINTFTPTNISCWLILQPDPFLFKSGYYIQYIQVTKNVLLLNNLSTILHELSLFP